MEISLLDVLGPVMIGPSSSHTAGAAKLARVARDIIAVPFFHVEFALHGSFAETYKGHGTDRALVAGVLGIREDDERLRNSFALADTAGITYDFTSADLGNVHENSVRIIFFMGKTKDSATGEKRIICGSSLGGGRILVTRIDEFTTEITMERPTVIVMWRDVKGTISAVSGLFATHGINIAGMRVSRTAQRQTACCVIETDSAVDEAVIREIRELANVLHARTVVGKGEPDVYLD